jgi:hypothetical protein
MISITYLSALFCLTRIISSSKLTVPIYRTSSRNPPSNTNQATADSPHSTKPKSIINAGDNFYAAKIQIGSGQSFFVQLDTGSSDLWLRGPSCRSNDGSCNEKEQNEVNLNDTAVYYTGKSFKSPYMTANVVGDVYKTTVSFQDLNLTMNIGVTTEEEGSLGEFDGILGLGFPTLGEINGANFMERAGCVGQENIFGFYLSNYDDGDESEFMLGGYDSTKFSGNITWLPLVQKKYWEFSIDEGSFQVGKTCGRLNGTAIADTGSNVMFLPDTMAEKINREIRAVKQRNGAYEIDCEVAQTGPDLTLTIGEGEFIIPPSICKLKFKY